VNQLAPLPSRSLAGADPHYRCLARVLLVTLERVPSKLNRQCASLPGLTRQSIILRRRWTRGSSPRVTDWRWINLVGTCSSLQLQRQWARGKNSIRTLERD